MKSLFGGVGLIVIIALGVTLYSSLYVVRETERALVLQFGEVVGSEDTPGLKFKIPFFQNVLYFDNRVLDLDSPVQEIIAADQERLVVDTFARFRITNSLAFFQTVGNLNGAQSRLSTVLNSATRRVLGEVSYITIVRDDRGALMASIRDQVNRESRSFGMEIVDVRIRRADLPEANSQAIFQRMQTEREREATEIRARGEEAAQRIRSRADREVTVLVADATRESEQIRGEGDGERTRIFAEAFGQDEEFFSFYRSMQAYEAGFSGGTSLVISPDSDFFRYFGDQQGGFGASSSQSSSSPARSAPAVQAQ